MSKKIKKAKASNWSADMAWRAQVLYLVAETKKDGRTERISVRDMRERLGCALGTVNKLVTEMYLDTIRSREDSRIAALLVLHRSATENHIRLIETEMERVTMTYSNMTALNAFRRDKDKKPEVLEPANLIVLRQGKGRRGNEVQINEAADALSWLLSKGKISQWMYDAGMKFRESIESSQSFRGQEVGKDAVQGGLLAGTISDGQAAAIDMLGEVKAAIGFALQDHHRGWWYGMAEKWCARATMKEAEWIDSMELDALHKVLEPIAWCYQLAPSGDVSKFLSGREVGGRLRQRKEIA